MPFSGKKRILSEKFNLRIKDVQHPNNPRPLADPLGLFPRGLTKMYSIWVSLTYPFASIGRNVSLHFTTSISRSRSPRIRLGNSISVEEYASLVVATEDPEGEPTIVIDDNCHIRFGTIISARNRVHLERDVLVAQQVLIMDHNHAYEDITVPVLNQGITEGGRVRIGRGSWIGHGAAIVCSRGELTIGRNCVVAANSVVTRSIPDYSVVVGMPATIIKQWDPETRTWRKGPSDVRATRSADSMRREVTEDITITK